MKHADASFIWSSPAGSYREDCLLLDRLVDYDGTISWKILFYDWIAEDYVTHWEEEEDLQFHWSTWVAVSSPKQIKQRMLASKLWQLTGAVGSLRNVRPINEIDQALLSYCIRDAELVIENLRNDLRNL